MNDSKSLKLYILILDDVPDEFAPVIAAHASMIADGIWSSEHFYGEEDGGYHLPLWPIYLDWKGNSFKKVVCRVNRASFFKAKDLPDVKVITESALDNREVALVVCPRYEVPNVLKFAGMWKPITRERELLSKIEKLEKKVSDYGWERDQASKHRMGL